MVCIVSSFIADAGEQPTATTKVAANQPIAVELQRLQGTWAGTVVSDKASSKKIDFQETNEPKANEMDLGFLGDGISTNPQSHENITITITGNSLHFHRDTNFWFETTFTLPVGTGPQQLNATIKGNAASQGTNALGKTVAAIFKIENETLTLAARGDGSEEMPKSFEATEDEGLTRYELRKVQPQKRNTEPPKPN